MKNGPHFLAGRKRHCDGTFQWGRTFRASPPSPCPYIALSLLYHAPYCAITAKRWFRNCWSVCYYCAVHNDPSYATMGDRDFGEHCQRLQAPLGWGRMLGASAQHTHHGPLEGFEMPVASSVQLTGREQQPWAPGLRVLACRCEPAANGASCRVWAPLLRLVP